MVGIPEAIGILIAAVAAIYTFITDAIEALNSHVGNVETEHRAIKQAVHDLGSSWAVPDTKAMSDATTADGDPSDWRLAT